MAEPECPGCASTKGKNESGVFALVKLSGRDTIQINLDSSTMDVMTVKPRICGNCGLVSFYDA